MPEFFRVSSRVPAPRRTPTLRVDGKEVDSVTIWTPLSRVVAETPASWSLNRRGEWPSSGR